MATAREVKVTEDLFAMTVDNAFVSSILYPNVFYQTRVGFEEERLVTKPHTEAQQYRQLRLHSNSSSS